MSHKKSDYGYLVRSARNKHRKALKRKYKKYDPIFHRDWRHSRFEDRDILYAPLNFSLLKNRNEVVKYFIDVKDNISKRIPTVMDLSAIEAADFSAICLLIATMMDGRAVSRRLFSYLTVKIPLSTSPARELFDKAQFLATVTKRGVANHNYFLSRLDTTLNQRYSLDILNHTRDFFGNNTNLITLSPILTEIFTNTNNHADPDRMENEPNKVPWFASVLEVPEERKLCYCVIDLGIGIHASLNRKGIKLARSGLVSWTRLRRFFNTSQSTLLSENIPSGVASSTGLLYRGQGLKDIYTNVTAGPYSHFELFTNRAGVNIKNISDVKQDAEYNLEGTIYYWEIYADTR